MWRSACSAMSLSKQGKVPFASTPPHSFVIEGHHLLQLLAQHPAAQIDAISCRMARLSPSSRHASGSQAGVAPE